MKPSAVSLAALWWRRKQAISLFVQSCSRCSVIFLAWTAPPHHLTDSRPSALGRACSQPSYLCAPSILLGNRQIWACRAPRQPPEQLSHPVKRFSAFYVPPVLRCFSEALARFLLKTCLSASPLSLHLFSDSLHTCGGSCRRLHTCCEIPEVEKHHDEVQMGGLSPLPLYHQPTEWAL